MEEEKNIINETSHEISQEIKKELEIKKLEEKKEIEKLERPKEIQRIEEPERPKEKELKEEIFPDLEDKEIKEMFEAGLYFGHRHTKVHPQMLPFIYGMRNNVDIIDLVKTKEYLNRTIDYLKEKMKENPLILFIGTKISAKNLIKELAEELNMPYVNEKWLGGTLTNFEIVLKRIKYLKEMNEKKEKGEFEKYSKKERLRIDQNLKRIERKMGGLKGMEKLPDLLFVIDVFKERLAIKEARMKNIPVIGICDTNGDFSSLTIGIPANDDAISSLKYILGRIKEVLKEEPTEKT